MQQKLKSVFRRSSKSRSSSGQSENNSHSAQASPPHGHRQRASSNAHGRTSIDSSAAGSGYNGRSRPVSSVYDDSPNRTRTEHTNLASLTDPNGGAIANDYKAYLPALSPVNDDYGDDYIRPIKNRQHNTGRSGSRHEEDVADRNIARYSSSFDGGHRRVPSSNSASGQQYLRKPSSGAGSARGTSGTVQTDGSVGKYSIGHEISRNGGSHDVVRSPTETTTHGGSSHKRFSFPPGATGVSPGIERKPLTTGSDKDASQFTKHTHNAQGSPSGMRHATVDGTAGGEETALAKRLREDGVADLRNTLDTDGKITWAPGT